jgi:predicted metal-dependent hydrolase
MTEALRVDNLVFEVRRSARRRTVGITVERNRSLIVHVPEHADLQRVEAVVEGRLVWVHQKLLANPPSPQEAVFRQPAFVDGEGFHFLGRHFRLKLVDTPQPKYLEPIIGFEGEFLLLRRDRAVAGERTIANYYARVAYPYLKDAAERWKSRVGAEPGPIINIADLGYRWGSCSVDGTLNFHWRVMQLPPILIDYVVVHELCHLKVPDHSPCFWAEVRRAMPNYQQHRRRLREEGGKL